MSELPKVAGQSVPGQPADLARLEACSPGTASGACVFPEPRTRPHEMDAASISQSNRRAGDLAQGGPFRAACNWVVHGPSVTETRRARLLATGGVMARQRVRSMR